MKKLTYLVILMTFFFGCKKDSPTTPINTTDQGTIAGVVYSANGIKAVPNAKVTMADNVQYQTFSDSKGSFSLKCPAGVHRFTFVVGSGDIFAGDFTVDVKNNQSITIPHDSTTLVQEKQLAFVPGYWDSIQNIVHDSLGYTLTELTQADLLSGNLQQYAIIFLNCGCNFTMSSAIYSNLDAYLQNGGNIYASDYAIDYLVGDGNLKKPYDHHAVHANHRVACGNPVIGGFIEDSLLCHNKVGNPTVITGATVQDPTMQGIFGNTVDLNYDLPSWAVLNHVETSDPRFKVLISDLSSQAYGPLLASIKWGNGAHGGNIMYTTFHNEANVTPDMINVLQWIVHNY